MSFRFSVFRSAHRITLGVTVLLVLTGLFAAFWPQKVSPEPAVLTAKQDAFASKTPEQELGDTKDATPAVTSESANAPGPSPTTAKPSQLSAPAPQPPPHAFTGMLMVDAQRDNATGNCNISPWLTVGSFGPVTVTVYFTVTPLDGPIPPVTKQVQLTLGTHDEKRATTNFQFGNSPAVYSYKATARLETSQSGAMVSSNSPLVNEFSCI